MPIENKNTATPTPCSSSMGGSIADIKLAPSDEGSQCHARLRLLGPGLVEVGAVLLLFARVGHGQRPTALLVYGFSGCCAA